MNLPRTRHVTVQTQKEALVTATRMAAKASLDKDVRLAAIAAVSGCAKNDVTCQLQQIYDAVKEGSPGVRGLERGVKYVKDPILSDFFTSPARLLKICQENPEQCGEDCDGHAMLIAAMCASIGIRSGLRAFMPDGESSYTHVYAVACPDLHERGPAKSIRLLGMDTTVDRASPGWEPSPGKILTCMLEEVT